MGHASLKTMALVVRQHNIGASTVMTSTAEEKAFLRVAVAAIPRVIEIILGFPPDDRAGALLGRSEMTSHDPPTHARFGAMPGPRKLDSCCSIGTIGASFKCLSCSA